jgi:hypothetical protein
MGYSCTKDAHDMLGLIRNQFGDGETSNGLVMRSPRANAYESGRSYFYEVGKEQADGAITGTLFLNVSDNQALRVGSFRINANGSIARFPRIRRDMRTSMYFMMLEIQRTDPQRLSSYSMGVL